jgi:hypothetical protein
MILAIAAFAKDDDPITPKQISDDWMNASVAQTAMLEATRVEAESNLTAIVSAYGFTNQPIDWRAVNTYALTLLAQAKAVQATNFAAGTIMRQDVQDLRQLVSEQLQWFVQNGGNSREVGKVKGKNK